MALRGWGGWEALPSSAWMSPGGALLGALRVPPLPPCLLALVLVAVKNVSKYLRKK